MKKYLFLISFIAFVSCQENGSSKNQSEKMVMGSPKAVVSTQPNSETQIKGPLAYAPSVPPLANSDTVEVKMDVTHKMIQVAKGVSFPGWVYGDSLPGPVLRVRVGQTIKFSMTDRSDDTVAISMGMRPMPHSIDFHSVMVNPADKYKSINPGKRLVLCGLQIIPACLCITAARQWLCFI
jgi:nitrite reductase (NO-forming)